MHIFLLLYLQGVTAACCPTGPTRIPGVSTANIVTLKDVITSVRQVITAFYELHRITIAANRTVFHTFTKLFICRPMFKPSLAHFATF